MDDFVDRSIKKEFVRRQECFSKLTEDEIEKLAELFSEVHFKQGETIVTEGALVDSVFLIMKGIAEVRQFVIKENKPESVSVAKLEAGEAIGLNEKGFYSLSGKRTASVIAMTDVIALRLNVAEFHGFALAHSHVSQVMRQNAESLK